MVGLKNTDSPRHELYVHQALIDEFCHPLCEELRKYWKVFDGETVGRFSQYLYQGDCDYLIPTPAGAREPTSAVSGGSEHATESPGEIGGVATNAIGDVEALVEVVQTSPLTYAKLYILSYSQGINALSDMCISRLRRELGGLSSPVVDTRLVDGVVQLLRYVYNPPRDVVRPEPLRPAWAELKGLVSELFMLNIEAVEGNQGFLALVEEGGTLAADTMAKTIRRLRSAEADLKESREAALVAGAALIEANQAAATAQNALWKTEHTLHDTECTLATTKYNLAETKSSLAETEASLAKTKASLAKAKNKIFFLKP